MVPIRQVSMVQTAVIKYFLAYLLRDNNSQQKKQASTKSSDGYEIPRKCSAGCIDIASHSNTYSDTSNKAPQPSHTPNYDNVTRQDKGH